MTLQAMPDLTGRTVVLTGATGFVGGRVLAACVSAGAEVAAIVRSARGAAAVERAGARAIRAGLGDRKALAAALQGCDALCHLAYDIRAGEAENLAAFDTLMTAAAEADVGRIVHTSSVVVYDDWPKGDLTEQNPRSSAGGGPYRQAKIGMEARLATFDLPSIILQPTLVYGPGSPLWTNAFANALSAGGLILPDPAGLCNAVYVDDVAQAFLRSVLLEAPTSETFLISGAAPVGWDAFLEGYREIVSGTLIREPADAMQDRLGPEPEGPTSVPLAARVSAVGRRVLGHDRFEALVGLAKRLKPQGPQGPMSPDHHMFGLFTARGGVSIDHARTRLGYVPAYDLAEGMAATKPYLDARLG